MLSSQGWKDYEKSALMLVQANKQLDGRTQIVGMDSAFQAASLRGVIQGLTDALVIPRNALQDVEQTIAMVKEELKIDEEHDDE